MLGIIIGIFSITVIFSISSATQKSLTSQLSGFMDNSKVLVYISGTIDEETGNTVINIPSSEIFSLEEEEDIKSVSEVVFYEYKEMDEILQDVEEENEVYSWSSYNCQASDYNMLEFDSTSNIYLVEGRNFTRMDDVNKMPFCIISQDIAQKMLGISENVVGKTITINETEFEIIGLYSSYDAYNQLTACVLNSFAKDNFNSNISVYNKYYEIEPILQDKKEVVTDIVNNRLLEYLNSDEYRIEQDFSDYENQINSIFGIVELVFGGIAGLSILVGGIGIMNIMLVSVNERIKEIGIRMALRCKCGKYQISIFN